MRTPVFGETWRSRHHPVVTVHIDGFDGTAVWFTVLAQKDGSKYEDPPYLSLDVAGFVTEYEPADT